MVEISALDNVVFIIGAPRSGTNMLRDVVTSFAGVKTWPCDEINYIMRHGNIRYASDEFPAHLARDSVKKYLRKTFAGFIEKNEVKILVEKTCANSLRIPFLNSVFPNAKFIFIYRDGIDATGSAKLRWTAKLDIAYIMEKVRYVPITDLPYYGARYLWARLHRYFSAEKRLAFWGPALSNMQEVLKQYTLNEVCAIQWQQCVEKADKALGMVEPERVYRVRYEGFVLDPAVELGKILNFLGLDVEGDQLKDAVKAVSSNSVGKGRSLLGEVEVQRLEGLVGETLKKYGYL